MKVETITVGEFEVNCNIVWDDSGNAVVIDPGDAADRITAAVRRRRLRVAAYWLTHGHADHVSALHALHGLFPAPVAMHMADWEWAFSTANALLPFYPAPQCPPAMDRRRLQGGEALSANGLTALVLATPGHSPGSVCFWFKEAQCLFSGDTLFAGSVGRTDLPGGSSRQLQASLGTLAGLPDATAVYPGHGPVTDIAREKRTNYFMRTP